MWSNVLFCVFEKAGYGRLRFEANGALQAFWLYDGGFVSATVLGAMVAAHTGSYVMYGTGSIPEYALADGAGIGDRKHPSDM